MCALPCALLCVGAWSHPQMLFLKEFHLLFFGDSVSHYLGPHQLGCHDLSGRPRNLPVSATWFWVFNNEPPHLPFFFFMYVLVFKRNPSHFQGKCFTDGVIPTAQESTTSEEVEVSMTGFYTCLALQISHLLPIRSNHTHEAWLLLSTESVNGLPWFHLTFAFQTGGDDGISTYPHFLEQPSTSKAGYNWKNYKVQKYVSNEWLDGQCLNRMLAVTRSKWGKFWWKTVWVKKAKTNKQTDHIDIEVCVCVCAHTQEHSRTRVGVCACERVRAHV